MELERKVSGMLFVTKGSPLMACERMCSSMILKKEKK
jgi:hypothetical protein